ncbi:hypothetical protein [Symbiopectobacterium sp. RP]|uniref:hypothetical protein n=1 Tax=Symbiopectobacterium sp. RP TaxID=3248553 RepID=UPI003D2BAA9B
MTYKKTLRHPKADESARQAFQQKIQQYEKKVNLLFLLMKVVFHTIPHELTAIPQKVNGVLA